MWVGLLVIVVARALFASGSSIKWLAVAPAKWSSVAQAAQDVRKHLPNYAALFIAFALLFGVSWQRSSNGLALSGVVPDPVHRVGADFHAGRVGQRVEVQPRAAARRAGAGAAHLERVQAA